MLGIGMSEPSESMKEIDKMEADAVAYCKEMNLYKTKQPRVNINEPDQILCDFFWHGILMSEDIAGCISTPPDFVFTRIPGMYDMSLLYPDTHDRVTNTFPHGTLMVDIFLRWVQDNTPFWFRNPIYPLPSKLFEDPTFREKTHIISLCFIDANSDCHGQFHTVDRPFFYEHPTAETRRHGHTVESYSRIYREIDLELIQHYNLTRVDFQTRTLRCHIHSSHRYAVQVWVLDYNENRFMNFLDGFDLISPIDSSGTTTPTQETYLQQCQRKRQMTDGNSIKKYSFEPTADYENHDDSRGSKHQNQENEDIPGLSLDEEDKDREEKIAELTKELAKITEEWRCGHQGLKIQTEYGGPAVLPENSLHGNTTPIAEKSTKDFLREQLFNWKEERLATITEDLDEQEHADV
ncbi:hypothetical protein B7463_g12000, partial [Scytalidium lignicola]